MSSQNFGSVFRELRDRGGVSMRKLAFSADMDPAYLSRMENGKSGTPKEETVERLADALCEELTLAEARTVKTLLLKAAGYTPHDPQSQIDELTTGFRVRLQALGFSPEKIDSALSQVALPTIQKILRGEERLEEVLKGKFSPAEIEALRQAGEQAIEQGFSTGDSSYAQEMLTAAEYLERHADEFATRVRTTRPPKDRVEDHVIRAGRNAEIRVKCPLNREQEQQLRLIGKLIDSITKGQ
jgi:transcriptional regulator with XRE-family HTH domain